MQVTNQGFTLYIIKEAHAWFGLEWVFVSSSKWFVSVTLWCYIYCKEVLQIIFNFSPVLMSIRVCWSCDWSCGTACAASPPTIRTRGAVPASRMRNEFLWNISKQKGWIKTNLGLEPVSILNFTKNESIIKQPTQNSEIWVLYKHKVATK